MNVRKQDFGQRVVLINAPFFFYSVGNVPPTAVETKPELESIEMTRESVFVGGRYLKYTRDVSQTPWSVGTTILAELSVSGIVCDTVKNAFRASGKDTFGRPEDAQHGTQELTTDH